MLGPFATARRRTPIIQVSLLTPPAHRCPRQRRRQQRQRVTEWTAMAPWNGPNECTHFGNLVLQLPLMTIKQLINIAALRHFRHMTTLKSVKLCSRTPLAAQPSDLPLKARARHMGLYAPSLYSWIRLCVAAN